MRGLRLIFWGLAVLFCLAGMGTGQRIFFVLLFIQLFLLVFAFLINLWAAFSFSYLQDLSAEQTLRGRPVDLRLSVHNEKILPYPLMHVRLSTPDRQKKLSLDFNLAAHSNREFNLRLECPHRGEYAVGMTVIDFFEPFGLLRLPFDMRLLPYYRMKSLLVYPQLAILDTLAILSPDSKAFSRNVFATDDVNEPFSMVRDYRRGDPRKLIHWKASARQHKLLTKLFDRSAEPRIVLVLDLWRSDAGGEASDQAEDVACECAASLMQYILRQNWPLQVVTLGKERLVSSGNSLRNFQQYYRYLATVEFTGTQPFSELAAGIAWPAARAVLLVTPRLLTEMPSALLRIRHQSQAPLYTIFALPAPRSRSDALSAAGQAAEHAVAGLMAQFGLPAWLIQYGDNLAEKLGGYP